MLKVDNSTSEYVEFAVGNFLAKINDRPYQRSWYKHRVFWPEKHMGESYLNNPAIEVSWLVACEAEPGKETARDKYSALVVSKVNPYGPKELFILFNGETKELLNGNILRVVLNEKTYKDVIEHERSIQRGFLE